MIQLRVKVKQLNKRKVIPSFLPDPNNIVGVVNENFTFEGEEVTVVPNKALGKWYMDRDGYFYWGGGLQKTLDSAPSSKWSLDVNKMSWGHGYYDVPFIWKDLGTSGSGVVVAVIDTGIDVEHNDLKSQIHPLSQSFVKGISSISDENGHGTKMAGIIAANGANKVYGVAPEAKLLILKGTIHMGGVNIEEFSNALNFAASLPEVDIISISYSFVDLGVNESTFLHNAIEKCINAKKIIVAAIGNIHKDNPDSPTYPACYNNPFPQTDSLLAIGAFDQSRNVWSDSNWSTHLRCLLPGETILTAARNNSITKDTGTSIATAFASGCLALLISYSKNNTKPLENCVPAILTTCDDIGNNVGFDYASGLGLVNLRNAISKIKT